MIQNSALKKIIDQQLFKDKKVNKAFDTRAFKTFEIAKTEMLRELDQHPITLDLQGGANSGLVDKGTLFGFLGFDKGEDPVRELRELLERSCKIRPLKSKGTTKTYLALIPSKDEIYSSTPLRWATGRSWVKAIEFGISGLGNYLEVDSPQSRSGEGIQSKTSNTGGRFRNSTYISSILNTFKKKLLSGGIKI